MIAPLRPTAPIAPELLLPGDPGRALALAQALLVEPRMANHHRGLWGYSGKTRDGRGLTIQATGIGGPSAAAVLVQLAALGARRAIRIGTASALGAGVPGQLIAVAAAIGEEGSSRALGPDPALPDPALHGGLAESAPGELVEARIVSVDPLPGALNGREAEWLAAGATAADTSTATLFAVARRLGVAIAAGLVVARAERHELTDPEIERASLRLGEIACGALG